MCTQYIKDEKHTSELGNFLEIFKAHPFSFQRLSTLYRHFIDILFEIIYHTNTHVYRDGKNFNETDDFYFSF